MIRPQFQTNKKRSSHHQRKIPKPTEAHFWRTRPLHASLLVLVQPLEPNPLADSNPKAPPSRKRSQGGQLLSGQWNWLRQRLLIVYSLVLWKLLFKGIFHLLHLLPLLCLLPKFVHDVGRPTRLSIAETQHLQPLHFHFDCHPRSCFGWGGWQPIPMLVELCFHCLRNWFLGLLQEPIIFHCRSCTFVESFQTSTSKLNLPAGLSIYNSGNAV